MKTVIFGGAGGTGSSTAFNLLCGPADHADYEVVLVDTRPNMITSHSMDLENVEALGATASTVRGGTAEDALDADVVVVSAAVPLRLNTSRMVFLADNARIVREVLEPLGTAAFQGVVLLLTNPVDPLVTWAHRQGWLPRHRLLGYTLNDSLRLRTGIAQTLGAHPREVDAWVIGEHGDGQVPLYDRVRVAGEPVSLTEAQRAAVEAYTGTWYTRHVALDSGRTSTWTTGLGAARMVGAIAAGSETPVPASMVLDGEYGVNGASLGVPVTLDRSGAHVLEWDIGAERRHAMEQAAARVDDAVASLDDTLA